MVLNNDKNSLRLFVFLKILDLIKVIKKEITPIFFILIFLSATVFVDDWLFGGDALNGTISNGQYYLANHENLKEVSLLVWSFCLGHEIFCFFCLTLALGLAAFFDQKSNSIKKIAVISFLFLFFILIIYKTVFILFHL